MKGGAGIVAFALVLVVFLPILCAFSLSVTEESELFDDPSFWPDDPTLSHYRSLFVSRDFWLPIRNSLVVALATTAVCVPVGALCAYALARLRFRGKWVLLGMILSVSLLPQVSILSPIYLMLRGLGLINTFPGLVLPYVTFALPLTVWFLVAFFRRLPPQLEEAARIDGASVPGTLRWVILPVSWPGLATSTILTFIYCWNEFLFALTLTLGPERQTVPVAIALFRGQYRVPWGEILAASVVATLPAILLVLLFQRRIVSGLTAGAVKG